jgi:heme-degrading monooxygenase HmoA
MIAIVWEFTVKTEALPAFRQAYGPSGDWAALFRRHAGYQGTTLLQDTNEERRFLTIDVWEDEGAFDRMHDSAQREYARLDARFEGLTLTERKLGVFAY